MTKNAATSTKPSLTLEGPVKRIDAGIRRISLDDEKQEIEQFLHSTKAFKKRVESVGADFARHQKGHRATYELLQEIYTIGLQLENSPVKYAVLGRLREELKQEGRKVDDTASTMSVIVKYAVPESSRQLVHVYNRVLRVAQAQGIEPEKLADKIENSDGGMSAFSRTPKQAEAAKTQAQERAERLALFKKYLTAPTQEQKSLEWDTFIDLTKKGPGQFFFFIGVPGANGTFVVSRCIRLDETQENLIAANLCAALALSNDEMRRATERTDDGAPESALPAADTGLPKANARKRDELPA